MNLLFQKSNIEKKITNKNNHCGPFAADSRRSPNYKRTLYNPSGRRAHTMCAKRRCGLSALLCSRRPQITCTIVRSQRREKEKLRSELRSRALLELARASRRGRRPPPSPRLHPFNPVFGYLAFYAPPEKGRAAVTSRFEIYFRKKKTLTRQF